MLNDKIIQKLSAVVILMLIVITPVKASVETGATWKDDFLTNSIPSYSWVLAHTPQAIPGGSIYEVYHHDSRDYSFSAFVSNDELTVIGDDWFIGRIFAYKTISFSRPVSELTVELKGKAYQGCYNNKSLFGAAVYPSDANFEDDFDIEILTDPVPLKGTWADTFENSLLNIFEIDPGIHTASSDVNNPGKDFVIVLLASDYWGWCNGNCSRTYSVFDYIKVEAVFLKIQADVKITPRLLNLNSRGKWINTFIELPENYDVNEVDVNTVKLNDQIPADPNRYIIGDFDEDGIGELMVRFDRAAVVEFLQTAGLSEMIITGELKDGTLFEGRDVIRSLSRFGPPI
jgi:hypothetical protein